MSARDAEVIVVGGGLAGLSAAWELQRRGHSALVLERGTRLGGRIRTERWRDARIELGVHFFTGGYRRLLRVMRELEMTSELVDVEHGSRLALRRGDRWHELDARSARGIVSLRAYGVRDHVALARALLPALVPPWPDLGDAGDVERQERGTIADALPAAVADTAFTPALELLVGYPPADQSYALLAALLPPRGRLRTLRGGMEGLVRALGRRCDARCDASVEGVEGGRHGVVVHAREAGGGVTYEASAAILAVRAHEARALWPDAPAAVRRFLDGIRYSSHQLLYLRTAEPCPRRGKPVYAELLGPSERAGASLCGLGFLDGWASGGGLVLAGAAPGSDAARLDDGGFADRLEREVVALHPGLEGRITGRRPVRGDVYVPVFGPGDCARLAELRRRQLAAGRIALAGDYLGAPCMEGALASSQRAAAAVAGSLREAGDRRRAPA